MKTAALAPVCAGPAKPRDNHTQEEGDRSARSMALHVTAPTADQSPTDQRTASHPIRTGRIATVIPATLQRQHPGSKCPPSPWCLGTSSMGCIRCGYGEDRPEFFCIHRLRYGTKK